LKQPYRIRVKDREAFYMAGLWTRRMHPEGRPVYSFTVITTEPNELMVGIHYRMPVILDRAATRQWLDQTKGAEAVMPLLRSYPAEAMEAYPVDPAVGSVKTDHPGLIVPYEPPAELG
ncbi:MAG: SOS response-associated peptidase family protein, partial [Bacteroidota bacterium]